MTTPRIARAGRSRFFIGIVSLLLMVGFVAIFHSSQQQLDESRQMRLRCEQQQEALNTRLQTIVEHKFRVEKTLEMERREHLETKKILEKRAKEQKELQAKTSQESIARLESVKQHYNLLQSEHVDLKENCEKSKATLSAQLNVLERKSNILQAQINVLKQQKETDVLHWKIKFETAEMERKRLKALLNQDPTRSDCHQKIDSLEKMLHDYKTNCNYNPSPSENSNHTPSVRSEVVKSAIEKSFKEQVPVSDGLYKIPIKLVNITKKMHETNTIITGDGINLNKIDSTRNGGIINSVENFQIAQKPLASGDDQNADIKGDNLQQPPPLRAPLKSSTAPTNSKTPNDKNNAHLPVAPVASVASPTSEKSKKSTTAANDRNKELYKSLGVAPVPEIFDVLIKNEEHNQSGNNNNNRYANVVDELSGKKDDAEQDNAAHEEKDNDFNLGDEKNDPKDHLQEVLDNMNNAAEDDTNNFFDTKSGGRPNKKGDDDDMEMVGANKHEKPESLLEGDEKLINEVVADQGKVAFPEGMHMEEAAEEDDDDYSNPAARQQEGPAVRN